MFPENELVAAVLIFEAANGNALSSDDAAEVAASGLRDRDPEVIADSIRVVLDTISDLSSSYRTTAFWTLGKRYDSRLRDFFRRHLAIEVERDMQVAYQVMIALDNLEEPVWPEEQSSCSTLEEE